MDLSKLRKGLEEFKIQLSQEQEQQFLKYYEMLIEKNKVMNLTAITEFDEVVEKHFLDSLSLVKYVDFNQPVRVADLGTGAGFPGIPLKIALPHIELVLMDSLNKRIKFLQEVIDELYLDKITAVHGRAEDLARMTEYREKFDFCVSRAVANLSSLSEYCIPFVQVGGNFISYKSGQIEDELHQAESAVAQLGGRIARVEKFRLEETKAERSFVIIEKIKRTAKKYPRKSGVPARDPIS